MEHMYTLREIVQLFVGFCGTLVTISAAITVILMWVKKLKQPTADLTDEIKACNNRLDEHDDAIVSINKKLNKDKQSIDEIKEGNRVTQRSLLAIMEVLTDEDVDKEKINKTKSDLNEYLVSK